jgi:hypothetical protein
MRDDRVIRVLERGMGRPLALAAAAFFVTIGVFVAGITLIVDSTTRKDASFPPVVTVAVPSTPGTSVVVSYAGGVTGKIALATLARGGAAVRTSSAIGDVSPSARPSSSG